uniref:Poly(A)-specific ribonuclease PARN n=1 Tax=Aceria tosichella TaxID=561515 RepID=A0A6G1SAF7_9ACAR
MDVTNENFLELLPEIGETIGDCDFIAIDTELSGLLRERNVNRFDLPEERFAREVESSRGYFIMQFGLSCFKRLDHLKYSNRTYNFYIFPQPHKLHGDINRTFSVQAHAIQFLCQHNFDFNKLFRHGVSYLTFQEKKLLTAELKKEKKAQAKVGFNKHGVPDFVPPSMMSYCLECIKKVNDFVEEQKIQKHCMALSSSNGDQDCDMNDASVEKKESESLGKKFEFRDCVSNHRRSVMKRVFECLPIAENLHVEYARDPDTNENYLVLEYMDKEVKSLKRSRALSNAKGFLEVLELIIVNKKPLVGHNLSLDLIQIINQFMEPLSDNYDAFKETCHSLFPVIYDTKYIAHQILDPKTLANNQSRLNDLYCQLRTSTTFPKISVTHTGQSFDDNQLPHQAGYDAYMSGYCFMALCEGYLEVNKSKRYKANRTEPLPKQQQLVDEFSNKIHLSFSHDFKYILLNGQEQQPDRSHVFYVEFPSTWALDDLFQLFYQYGGVEASRLSSSSALCGLRDHKQRDNVLKHIKHNKDANYRIYTYEYYMDNLKQRKKRPSRVLNDEDADINDVDQPDDDA